MPKKGKRFDPGRGARKAKKRAFVRDLAEASPPSDGDQVKRLLDSFPTEAQFRAREEDMRAREVPVGVYHGRFEALAFMQEAAMVADDDESQDDGW